MKSLIVLLFCVVLSSGDTGIETTVTAVNSDKPPTPQGVSQRGSNTAVLDIRVEPIIAANVTAYRFEILPKDEYKNNTETWTTARVVDHNYKEGQTYLITDLTQATRYVVRVASRNERGISDYVQSDQFFTFLKKEADKPKPTEKPQADKPTEKPKSEKTAE